MVEEHSCGWRQIAEQQAEQLALKIAKLDELAAKVTDLEHKLAQATKQIIGPKSERMPTPDEELKKRESESRGEKKPKRGGYTNPEKRKKNAEAKAEAPLQTTVERHSVPDEERRCPHCGEDAKPIGDGEVSHQYNWVHGYFRRVHHVVETARCPCKLHYVRGPAPPRVQPGCQYGAGFVAKLVVDRCADATPIYRVETELRRLGIPIARSTMSDLVHMAGNILLPLWQALYAELRVDPHIQADETSFRTQIRPERSFIWTFLSKQATLYVYSPSRSGDTPKAVLGGTTGALTVDGYTGYKEVTEVDGRERTGCWSHARRYLFEALPSAPEACAGLDIILDLFAIERKAKTLGIVGLPEHRRLRGKESIVVLDHLLTWMKATWPLYEPKSVMGRALRYISNQWHRLTAFVEDPKIPIHNNASEASLRIIALTRKNSLFFGNDAAAERFMVLHSLIATCEKHGVNPVAYFTDVLMRIQDHPKLRVAELLPHRWRESFGKEPDEAEADSDAEESSGVDSS